MASRQAYPSDDDSLEQPLLYGEHVPSLVANTTGPVCACGWPQKPYMKLTACMSIDYSGGRTNG